MAKQKIVSGMRPTGPLHLGNYFGALRNWIDLQDKYECLFFVADWHSLTTEYADPSRVAEWRREVLLDWLGAGLDPEKSTIFVQSDVPAHAELHLLLSMLTPLGWLERVPSYKEIRDELSSKELNMYGFLGYPLLQTADVILYKGELVPVGEDQVAHIELTREVVRRFNHLYGKDVFPEPKPLLTTTPKVPGLDRRKMSKSYNNCIYIRDDAEEIKSKIMPAKTDPARKLRSDPGNPDVCTIYDYHKLFSNQKICETVNVECRSAGIGCVDCKKMLLEQIENKMGPIREKRTAWASQPKKVAAITEAGAVHARKLADVTLAEVNEAMGIK